MTNHKLQTNDAVRNPTKEQWEEIVRVAKEQGIRIYKGTLKDPFPRDEKSCLVYDFQGELAGDIIKNQNFLPFEEFISRMGKPQAQGLQQGEGLADVTADQWEIIKLIAEKYEIPIGPYTFREVFPNKECPCLCLEDAWLIGCTRKFLGFKPLSFDIFLQKLINTKIQRPINVRLNENHTAVVTVNGVMVGCQEFTHEVIKELYEACLKVKPNA